MPENVVLAIQVTDILSGKITTVPRLFSENSLQSKNTHQIMNVPMELFDTHIV